jgi:FKBP12-rapamycin complex-associated protein
LSVPSTATAGSGGGGDGGGYRTYSDVDAIIEREGPDLVILALETLGKLTQPNTALLPVVQQVVLPYLEAHDSRVRTAAVSTCANLILPPHEHVSLRGPSARATETIVSRLLEVAVSDTSRRVRLTVMHCLDARFDRYLSQTHHIDRVMFLFSDDIFDIRSEALTILGRLAKYVRDPHSYRP